MNMIFDGIKWRRSRNVRMYRTSKDDFEPNLKFGKLVYPGKPLPKKAVKTVNLHWTHDDSPCWVIPIEGGHGLTNKLYAKKRETHFGQKYVRAYLQYDGETYTAKWPAPEK